MTKKLSQNKKIGLAVLAVFMLSFTAMVLFLDSKSGQNADYSRTSILDVNSHESEGEEEVVSFEVVKTYDFSIVPVFMLSPQGQIEYANKAFCELMGEPCEDLENQLFFDYVNPKDLPELAAMNTELFYYKEKQDAGGPFRLSSGNKEILVLLSGKPVMGADEEVTHILFSAKDISEQVEDFYDDNEEERQQEILMTDNISYLDIFQKFK